MSGNSSNTDQELTSLLQKGDQQAIARILEKYGDALYGSIYQMVQSEAIAKDLMQDACVKIWKNGSSYDPNKGRLFTWILRIARNTALDKIRTEKFQRQQTSESIEQTVSNAVAHSEEMQIQDVGLQQVISRLDEKYRVIIDLIYLQGYTQKEATEALNIPLGTVKSRVKIAIRELRTLLNDCTLPIFIVMTILTIIEILLK